MRSLRTRAKLVHVTLRHSFPDHVAREQVGAFAHGMAQRRSIQKFDGLLRDGVGILEGNQRAAAVVQQLDRMPVGSRDDRLARPQRIGKRPGNHLRLVAIGSDVDVGGANELRHLLRTDEAVVEDHLRFHSHFLRQSLQAGSILVALATENVRMGRARDHVDHVLVFRQNLRHGLNDVFDSLVRREQAEGEQHRFAFHAEAVLVEIGIEKGQVGNAVRNHVDLAAGHLEDFLQELGRELAHDDEAVGKLRDLFHDHQLVGVGLAQDRVQRGHDRHLQAAQQMQDMASGRTAEDSILVLQAHHVDIVEVQEFSGFLIR